MPNPFLRFKKKAYVELAVAVCVITSMVIVLCLFSGEKDTNGLSAQTAVTSSSSSSTANIDATNTSGRKDKSKSDKLKTDEVENSSKDSKINSGQNDKEYTTVKKTTAKKTKSRKVTAWSPKNNYNNTGTSVNKFNYIDNFQKHMTSGLNADQMTVLNQILKGIENFETDISIKDDVFKNDDLESLKSLFVLVKIACIENSSVSSTYKYAGNSEYITAIKLTYTKTRETALSEAKQLNQKVDSILNGITVDMNEFEKIRYIHDTINKLCVYGESSTGNKDSAYGCLIEGKAICEGYSKAFLLLCNRAGIDSTIVTGTATADNGEVSSHMWNMVMIGGKWYHIDLTWDDPTLKPLDKNYVRYDFFNVTDSEISQTHTIIKNKFYDYPKAYSAEYNYFVYYGYCGIDYDSSYEAMEKAVADAALKGNKYASIRLNNSKTYTSVKKKLFETSNGKTPIFTLLKDVKKKINGDFSTASISKIFMEQTNVITVVLK